MYPQGSYFGLAPPYYGFVGFTTVAVPPPPPVVTTPVVNAVTTITGTIPAQYVREKPPVTTVFVGNIEDAAPDTLIKSLLMRCGNILSWKRVQGASGKLQAFGFCEFEDPESTMRCVRLLNGFAIGSKALLAKVDPKTEDLLNEYRKKKEQAGEEGTLGATSAEVDSSTLRDDEAVKVALEAILKENSSFLEGSPRRVDAHLEGPRHLTIEDMNLDSDRKDLINREIEIFRKRNENEDQGEGSSKRTRHREYERPSIGLQMYASLVESERRERRDRVRRSRSRSMEVTRRFRGSVSSSVLISSGKAQVVDEEEENIRKKLERKLREKEESYQKRLKQWETRERKKANEYEHEQEHENKRQRELQVEAQRLREFFEDYDDDVEDLKYYRGSALHQRFKDRAIEEATDERDRQKEIEQLEAARRKLIEEGDPKAESIILQMEQKMQEHLRKRLKLEGSPASSTSSSPCADTEQMPLIHSNCQVFDQQSNEEVEVNTKSLRSSPISGEENEVQAQVPRSSEFSVASTEEASGGLLKDASGTFLFAMSAAEPVVRKKAAAFTEDDFEEKPRKRPSWLTPSAKQTLNDTTTVLDHKNHPTDGNEIHSNAAIVATFTPDEKKAIIKRIIDGIPTGKRDLFNYPIDWDIVDATFVSCRIKPWVDKKIVSYIGESEATLSNFICDQLLHHNPPERVLADIAMVLDEEAEVFVVKMWRLLIYLIAEKKAGLSS